MNKQLAKVYRIYHWGADPDSLIDTRSRFHSKKMVEYGRCCEFHLSDEMKFSKQEADYILEIPEKYLHQSHLFFDNAKKRKPLMIELDPSTQKEFVKLYKDNPSKPMKLKDLAKMAGGYQSNRRYPNIKAKPLGYCVDIVYRTVKKPDGLTNYIHTFGEPYRKGEKWSEKPILAVASSGEVFLCGGNYKCKIEGIVN